MMSNSVMSKINMKGKKNILPFIKTNLYKVISGKLREELFCFYVTKHYLHGVQKKYVMQATYNQQIPCFVYKTRTLVPTFGYELKMHLSWSDF